MLVRVLELADTPAAFRFALRKRTRPRPKPVLCPPCAGSTRFDTPDLRFFLVFCISFKDKPMNCRTIYLKTREYRPFLLVIHALQSYRHSDRMSFGVGNRVPH
jgi:hypothetical protein